MTDDLELPADETPDDEPVVASYLVRVVLRSTSAIPPTIAQVEDSIRTMVAASWQGFTVTAKAERVDR